MVERGSWGGFERGYAATLPPFILTHPSLSPLLEETVFDQCPPLQDHSTTTHTMKSERERLVRRNPASGFAGLQL